MPITRQAIAKHLALLDEAGLVERRTAGREVEFFARPGGLADLAGWMASVGSEWDDRLSRLRQSFD